MNYRDIIFDKDSVFLITGGAGFIGSNLCEAVLDMGYKVKCLDNLSTGKRRNVDLFTKHPNYTFIEGDIRDLEVCMSACKGVRYVLHQAAWGSVPRSIELPLVYNSINVNGTLNIMEAARQSKVKKFVYASSSSVYGDEPDLPQQEGKEGNLLSPYAVTKQVDEEYGKIYARLYDLDTYGLRYFNVFGKRQDTNGPYAAVIPKFIMQLMNNERPTINGDGQQSRDFTFIENVVEANIRACIASHSAAGEVYNIAYNSRISLLEVYDEIRNALGKEIKPIFGKERKGEIKHSSADISKARRLLGYEPYYSFLDGIILTIAWYKEEFGRGA